MGTPTDRPAMDRSPRRRLAILSIALTLISLGATAEMSRRIVAYHRANPPEHFAFRPVEDASFTWAGHPVSFTNDDSNPGARRVVVRYADQELRLIPSLPSNDLLPGLVAHADWLRVQRFIPVSGLSADQVMQRWASGEITERLVIVTRHGRPGADPATWGAVWRRDWEFDFYELLPDATIRHERLGFPTARATQAPKPGELRQNTWQFQAALALMPPIGRSGPAYNFSQDAIEHSGWALPVAVFGSLAALFTGAFALAPRRRAAS